jgi:hypothetical protein
MMRWLIGKSIRLIRLIRPIKLITRMVVAGEMNFAPTMWRETFEDEAIDG